MADTYSISVRVSPKWVASNVQFWCTASSNEIHNEGGYSNSYIRITATQNTKSINYDFPYSNYDMQDSAYISDNGTPIKISAYNLLTDGFDIFRSISYKVIFSSSSSYVETQPSTWYEFYVSEGNPPTSTLAYTVKVTSYVNTGYITLAKFDVYSGSVKPSLSISRTGASHNITMNASYNSFNIKDGFYAGNYDYKLIRDIDNKTLSQEQLQDPILESAKTVTFAARHSAFTNVQVSTYRLVVNVDICVRTGTNKTTTALLASFEVSSSADFYPLTDIVTASAPIALDAGNNLLYVDASKCFSSNMGYTPKRYVIDYNADTEPIGTQSDTGIEFIPHTENRNDVSVDVYIYYDTLEGEEKCVVSEDASIDLRYVSPPSTTTATLTKINDEEYIPIEGSTEDSVKLKDVLTFQMSEPCSYILGDVNGDGVVDNKDSGLLMQYLNNWTVQINKAAADVNGDGKINNNDYSLIQQYLNGWTTSSIGHRFITTDAFEIIPHITMKNGITKSFKLDKELNSHLNGYYFESGHKGFMNEDLDNYDCGGYIKTEITNANITNHYPSPIPLKNKPLSEFNIVKWDGTTANSFASGSGTEDDPYIIETPSQLSWMCSGAGSTEWNSTTFGKYYKIADGIDAFDLCGHSGVTLETSAAQLKSISSDGIYNINHASNNWLNNSTKKSMYDDGVAFAGTFDANGCIIFNMFAAGNAPSLFPWIGVGATVKNLILKSCRSWQWNNYDNTQPTSGFLYGGMDNGAGYNNGNNPNYAIRQTNTNIKFENCVVCDCYGNSFGISRSLVGGWLRYVNMCIDNCLFFDNILEISNQSATTKDDLYMFGGLIGGSYDQSIAPDTTLKVNGCVIVGDSVMPQIINTSSLYPVWGNGDQVSDWLTNNSNNYINCYRSVESSDDYILSSKINNLIESQMRNSKSEMFMTDLDWITPNWYSVNPTTTDVLNSDELYIKINTGEPLKLYNEDGTIENYILKKNDKVFIEVRSYTYENSTYMVDASEDSRNSRPVILYKGIIIPVKVENEDGTSAYKCGTVFVKTPSGYKEGSSMFIKNINNYMEV